MTDNAQVLKITPQDTVAVALADLPEGAQIETEGVIITARRPIPAGHKLALKDLPVGEKVTKYGSPIGRMTQPAAAGEWVHTHNLVTLLDKAPSYRHPKKWAVRPGIVPESGSFEGYRRPDGRAGTRNEIWILPTVGCVNAVAQKLAEAAAHRLKEHPTLDGVAAFSHQFGCSQLGEDLERTGALLAALTQHPNAGGVLLVGLGCENNSLESMLRRWQLAEPSRIRSLRAQDVEDEVEAGLQAVLELARLMEGDKRQPCPVEVLVLGLKCGGSDAFSGITANPLVGRVSDWLTARGGAAILTEIPELFGAEDALFARCADEQTHEHLAELLRDFRRRYELAGVAPYANPSPGNIAGGITTLEEKSLGCVQKSGNAVVSDVIRYAGRQSRSGLTILEAPGNDAISGTALAAAGATVILFTTGRGTPLGFPVPTVKIASNSELAKKKHNWIDFNAGHLLEGQRWELLTEELITLVIDVASGRRRPKNFLTGNREIAIWKDGVTL